MTERHTVDSITSDALDQLYDRAEGAEAARDRLLRSRDRQADRARSAAARVTELEAEVADMATTAATLTALMGKRAEKAERAVDRLADQHRRLEAEVARLTAGQCTHARPATA